MFDKREQLWMLVERVMMYHYGKEKFLEKVNGIGVKYDFKGVLPFGTSGYIYYSEYRSYGFIKSISQTSVLTQKKLLEHVAFNRRIQNPANPGWNWYGSFVGDWYPEIIKIIENSPDVYIDKENERIFVDYEEKQQHGILYKGNFSEEELKGKVQILANKLNKLPPEKHYILEFLDNLLTEE